MFGLFARNLLIGILTGAPSKAEISDHRNKKCADSVNNQIFHGVRKGGVTDQLSSIRQAIFLHIQSEQCVSRKLIDLPNRTRRERETESEERDKCRAEVDGNRLVVVEYAHKGETQGAEHRAAKCVQVGVPVGHEIEKLADFSEIDRAIQKKRNT